MDHYISHFILGTIILASQGTSTLTMLLLLLLFFWFMRRLCAYAFVDDVL